MDTAYYLISSPNFQSQHHHQFESMISMNHVDNTRKWSSEKMHFEHYDSNVVEHDDYALEKYLSTEL